MVPLKDMHNAARDSSSHFLFLHLTSHSPAVPWAVAQLQASLSSRCARAGWELYLSCLHSLASCWLQCLCWHGDFVGVF